jgi:ABC-type sulfate transport system permease component
VFVPCYGTLLLMHEIFLGYAIAQLVELPSSIPDGVTGIFLWSNPSGRTITLGSTQPHKGNEYKVSPISLWVEAAGN